MSLKGLALSIAQVISATTPLLVSASPTTGQTVTLPDTAQDMIVYLTPAGALLALTLALPSDAVTIIGQTIRVFSTSAVTTVTLSNTVPVLSAIVLNGGYTLQKVAANSWVRF